MDDTFSLCFHKNKAFELLDCLNGLHPSSEFTMESEVDRRLPFLDVLVIGKGEE